MKLSKILVITIALMPALMAATLTNARNFKLGALEISQPWARATPKGAETGAGYLTIKNGGSTPDRLVAATLSNAASAQIHEMAMDNGVMKMREVSGGLEIKPGDTVTLKPNGFHVMFMGLKAPLANGQSVSGSLTFEKAGTIAVEFEVAPAGSPGPQGATMQQDKMKMDHMH